MRDLGIIEDGSVLIKNSEIAAVGPTRRIENLKEAKTAAVISAVGRVVMPGFVDAQMDIMPGETGRRHRGTPVGRTAQDATTLLRSALQHGTTRAEIKVGGVSLLDDLRYLRQMKKLDTDGRDMVRTWLIRPGSDEAKEIVAESRRPVFEWLARKSSAAFAEIDVDDRNINTATALARLAAEHNMICKLVWRRKTCETLLNLLSDIPFHSVAGLGGLDPDHLGALAASPTTYIFTGGAHLWNEDASEFMRALIDANGAVAIASGYDSMNSPVFNMQMVVAQAVLQMKMATEEAITAATINAAHASGIGKRAGSLEFNKQADMLLLNLSDYRELPRQFGMNHVGMVIRSGSVVFNRIGWKAGARAS